MSDIQTFLKEHNLFKCPRCNKLIWVHFDVTATCPDCTLELYKDPSAPKDSHQVIQVFRLRDQKTFKPIIPVTNEEYAKAVALLVNGEEGKHK